MATYLLKTEPGTYSFANLQEEGKTRWSGVTSNAALAHLRAMRKGDQVYIYHTGSEKSVVGMARVVKGPYADPEQPGTTPAGGPKFAVVDIEPVAAARSPLSLAQIKADPRFKDFALVRQSRLSVMPVAPALDKVLRALTGL